MFKVKKIEVDASHDLIVMLLEEDAKELGLQSGERVSISSEKTKKSVICELEIIDFKKGKGAKKDINLKKGEIGLFESAFEKLAIWENKEVKLIPAKKPESIEFVKRKFLGEKLEEKQFLEIMKDIVNNSYSEIETTYFVLACTINKLDEKETISLTKAMVAVGKQLDFKIKPEDIIVDKHCIGGIAGNRTTMIVVPIIAAAGLTIPKTSSRSITSPAGTADTMEVLANVNIKLTDMFNIVKKTKGCIVWGGGLDLSPADDLIIHVEHPLELDSEGQMIASILSKKKSVGSTHVLIDIPIGKTAKVTDIYKAEDLKKKFERIGAGIGMKITVLISDGKEPIGNGIGPREEAVDVMAVLKNEENHPVDLREKAVLMAGLIFEMANISKKNQGYLLAREILLSGKALEKFEEIIIAQGKKKELPKAKFTEIIKSKQSGKVTSIHNKHISKLAFILGAPQDKAAGIRLIKKSHHEVKKGEGLYTIYSNSELKLKYAKHFIENHEIYTIK